MKSLALHLILTLIFLLGLLLMVATTTTAPQPSVPQATHQQIQLQQRQQRRYNTQARATTNTTTTSQLRATSQPPTIEIAAATSKHRRQPQKTLQAHANIMDNNNSNNKNVPIESTTFASMKLARSASAAATARLSASSPSPSSSASLPSKSLSLANIGVRQNRSFLSNGASVQSYNGNTDTNNNNNVDSHRLSSKEKQFQRRQNFRTIQHGSDSGNTNNINIAATTTTSASPTTSTAINKENEQRSSSTFGAAGINAHVVAGGTGHHQSLSTTFVARQKQQQQQHEQQHNQQHHRQSKQSILPLVDSTNSIDANAAKERAAHAPQPPPPSPQINNNSTTSLIEPPQQTLKTPRMIQRLVAGHLQNAEGRSTQRKQPFIEKHKIIPLAAITTTTRLPPTIDNIPLYNRRRHPMLSSSFRTSKPHDSTTTSTTVPPEATSYTTTRSSTPTTSITEKPASIQSLLKSSPESSLHNHKPESEINTAHNANPNDDDEALLEDAGDFDNWDNGILRLSAGSGKENSIKSKKPKDDSKKTLSDQVRDGKYGLIEKELFRREPKRPGVLSYTPNKEVPEDNEHNYGGLNEEDIWLAEDHLLVIKGGSLNDDSPLEPWPPIDDYEAPGRQIKIPPNPKVPPPFPVQLEENGPVQFIGNNKFTFFIPVTNESVPVYTVGKETNYTPAESDSDNEKNSLTRPGSAQDAGQVEPDNQYPTPYPPWVFHNQTFVNPILGNARPINFPGLGPFPFGRNGTVDSLNNTDYFDEDDPSLYYPPAYSFVYKKNYTNPVPPGPLVPGIVVPPPPDQFSRLVKPQKIISTTLSPVHKYRGYLPPTSVTTTTTPGYDYTSRKPFGQVITRITEYTPKTIIITPASLPPATTPTTPVTRIVSTLPPTPTPTPIPTPSPTPPPTVITTAQPTTPKPIEPIPVPVAVPIPVYPIKTYSPKRPSIVNFVPTTPQPVPETLSKSNPIYYEYFEAKNHPGGSNVIDDFLSTTPAPTIPPRPFKIYNSSKRIQKPQPQRHFGQENIVYITPKPETHHKPHQTQNPVYKPRPLEDFEQEVNAIRETLHQYQNQQLLDNSIPQEPKTKPIYEFTYDATKNLQPVEAVTERGNFQPPQFDEEPFRPMVTYSPPADDEKSFRAIAFDKIDNEIPLVRKQQQSPEPRYQSTTTLIPLQNEALYQTPQGRPKKLRLGGKHLQESNVETNAPQEEQYQTSPNPNEDTQPWVAVGAQQLADFGPQQQQQQQQQQQTQQFSQQPHFERLQLAPPQLGPRHGNGFRGYYYNPPLHSPPSRQNHRFYDEPFQNPIRKVINYRPSIEQQQQQQQQQQQLYQSQQQQQQPVWNLENDTYVNYAPNRPPLNPDAEFIDPYFTLPVNPYPQRPPLAISHQSQYYPPPLPHRQQSPPPPPPSPPFRQQHHQQQQQQQQPIPLHRDILVNYLQPRPPFNPDAEYISQPQVVRNQPNQIYRSKTYRVPYTPQQGPPPPQPPLPFVNGGVGGQSNVYYLTPKYRRANNNNAKPNNSNNKNNNNNRNTNPSRPEK